MSQDLTPQSSPEPQRLGSELASAREQRGLSIEDVAAATRIRAQLIRDIEQDQFGRCGGATYARGHIKAIAQLVGADADALVAEYDRRQGGTSAPALMTAPLSSLEPSRDVRRARRRAPHWASAAIAVLAVFVVFLGASWLFGDDGSGAGENSQVLPTSEPTTAAPEPEPSASPSPSVSPSRPAPPARPPGVSLRVQAATEPSWVRVESSTGEELFASILEPGASMEWRDPKSLKVKFGNAPAVRLVVNGRQQPVPCDKIVCTVEFPASSTAG